MFTAAFTLLLALHQTLSFDYCTLNCANEPHTACGDQCAPAVALCGSSAKQLNVTEDVRAWFLEKHNEHRNRVALGYAQLGAGFTVEAADMHLMEWDEELEYVARCWVNQCTFGHDSCRPTETWSWVGQNAYALLTTDVNADLLTRGNMEGAVDGW